MMSNGYQAGPTCSVHGGSAFGSTWRSDCSPGGGWPVKPPLLPMAEMGRRTGLPASFAACTRAQLGLSRSGTRTLSGQSSCVGACSVGQWQSLMKTKTAPWRQSSRREWHASAAPPTSLGPSAALQHTEPHHSQRVHIWAVSSGRVSHKAPSWHHTNTRTDWIRLSDDCSTCGFRRSFVRAFRV